ncbi:uncharacterized protein LOC124551056 isoform X1 [Schistocerca americana]|uniref:uncharacterized protein LOC124551056 isoform X1 n=1 Tax=Schistocerca americana TaxID=7009 RepID=UPI001F4FA7D8|nr:uncharacterized protein LOC124551056 isoform X1 [Schistocerca americana]
MSIECKCDVTALCSDMASDALKTTGVAKEQNTAKGNAHRVQAEQREASQSDEAECEEGIRKQPEGARGPEPPHHARRPMNAFLIFCKRHRGVVRDRFPHLENRSVTKILGEWWANLEAREKASYTELAKQYKEAFLQANPDFKWYKLPAPPLRTLVTRPSNQTRPLKLECDTACGGPITPGKLADETQMGSLSSLLASLPPPGPAPLTPPPVPPATGPPKPPKKRYLQELGAGEAQHVLPMPPVYRLRMAASEETDRTTESRSPFRQLRPSSALPQQGGVLGEGTTLKTSQQDIIDRVVDRMCRLSDSEGIGSKLLDNNNDAQYPCSRERSLVGDVESRCCTGAQSHKSLFRSSGSPGPPVEENSALEVAGEMSDGEDGIVVPPGFEDSPIRLKGSSTVRNDSEDYANFPVGAVVAGGKLADELKDFSVAERESALSSFRSGCELGTVNSTVDCLNLKKTKASLKEFPKKSYETIEDSIMASCTSIGEVGCSSTRESSVSEESITSGEKMEPETKTKVSKDLCSSSSNCTQPFSASPQDKGVECPQQHSRKAERQRIPGSLGGNPTSFECPSEECSLLTDKYTSNDCITQLSPSQDTSNNSVATKNVEYVGPILAVTSLLEGDNSVRPSTAASGCLPNAKPIGKRGHLCPKVKKLHHSESVDNVQNASDLLKCVDCPGVPLVSTEEQRRELTVSHAMDIRSKESTDNFSGSKLKEHVSSDVLCRAPDVGETVKIQGKKPERKLLQVKPSVRTVESATQFDGGTYTHVFVSKTSKNERSKIKNDCSTALLKYRHVVDDTEGKDSGKTEGLATIICHTNDTGIFPPLKSADCNGECVTNYSGEVKVKTANEASPANILNHSTLKKPGKLRGASRKREHFLVSTGSEMSKIQPGKHFKRMKMDNKIPRNLQTKNVPMVESTSKGFTEGAGVALPHIISEGRGFHLDDQKQATGSETSNKCLDLKVYSTAQKGDHKETVVYGSENFKSAGSTICSADANKDNISREEKVLCEVPFHSVSSELSTDVENNSAFQMCESTIPSVREASGTRDELAEMTRTEENPDNTDNVELVNICGMDQIINSADEKTCDESAPNTSSKLVRTSVPVESYEGSNISVVEESIISELTATSSSVILDIDLDLTQTRLSPQGLADLAAKDGVVVLTLPVDDELVLPPLLSEPQPAVVAVQPAAVECLEAASQTLTDVESRDTAACSIVGGGVLSAVDKDTSSNESEDSRESMSEEIVTAATNITEAVPLEASDAGPNSAAVNDGESPSVGGSTSGAVSETQIPLTGAGECLPVMDESADFSVSIQKSEENYDGELNAVRRKSTRTCKGLRYHQFMVEGRLKKGHRRPLSRGSSEKGGKVLRSSSCALAVHSAGVLASVPVTSPSDVTCALPSVAVPPVGSSNALSSSSRDVSSGSDRSDAEMDMPLEMRNRFSSPDNLQRIYTLKSKFEKPGKDVLEDSMPDSPAKKRFRAADFNLEEKIEALPSLSLEEFQMKKKARKRKVAPPLPPPDSRLPPKQTVPSPAVSPDSTEGTNIAGNRVTLTVEATAVVTSSDGSQLCSTAHLQSAGGVTSASAVGSAADASRQLVGSQKRKARKQSITRLDSDNVRILRDTAVVEPAVLSNIALSSLATIAVTGSKLVK